MTEQELYELQKLQAHADHLLEQLNAANRKVEKLDDANTQLRAENEQLSAKLVAVPVDDIRRIALPPVGPTTYDSITQAGIYHRIRAWLEVQP